MYITLILFLFILFLTYISIVGIGKLFLNLSNLNINLVSDFKILEFIFGLICIGFFGIIINFITNINDFITLSTITFGVFLYFLFFIKTKNKKNEIYSILLVVFISFCFAFYTLSHDDPYHFDTVILFKELNIFERTHSRATSYNSHWLLINAVYYLKSFPASVFCITALLYSLTLSDFFVSLKRNYNNSNYLPAVYSFFCLVFLIGVINNFKDYGTDFPGQIIILFIFLIFFEKNKEIIQKNNIQIFFILISLAFFALTIKITNILIFSFLFLLFLQIKRKIKIIIICLFLALPTFLWLVQNYIISSCLIWPVSFTCFANQEKAIWEMQVIRHFAMSLDISTNKNMEPMPWEMLLLYFENFRWTPIWFKSHFPKIIETYATYFILLLIPPIIFRYKNLKNQKKVNIIFNNNLFNLNISNSYIIFCLVSIFSTLIWFLHSPAYRFGIIYNLNFLIIFLIPLWQNIFLYEKLLFKKFVKILIFISLVFFVYENIFKYKKYFDRHGTKWPNISENRLIYKKQLIN